MATVTVAIPKEQQMLLTRRPSRVDSLFEIPKTDTTGGMSKALAKAAALFGKHLTTACNVSFDRSDIVFTASDCCTNGKKKSKGLFRRKSDAACAMNASPITKCNLMTSKIEVAGAAKGVGKKRLVKLRITDAKGTSRKIYASSLEDAGGLVRAIINERERAFEESSDGNRYGREILELLRERDISNRVCADCGTANPEWVSMHKKDGLTSLVCLECAGYHRNLGVEKVFVQSLLHDSKNWEPGSAYREAVLNSIGNSATNKIRTGHALVSKRRRSMHHAQADVQGASPLTPVVDCDYIKEKYAAGHSRSKTTVDEVKVNPDHERKRRRTADVDL